MNSIAPLQLPAGTLQIHVSDSGTGQPYLLLHGGAGPTSMDGLAVALAKSSRAIVPTHPGFAGSERPEWFSRVNDMAMAYLTLLDFLELQDVVIVGNSVGGWIAAEMGLQDPSRIAGVVLLNAVGIDTGSPDKQIVDPMKVAPSDLAALAYYDPVRFAKVPTSPEAVSEMVGNQSTLRIYAGAPFMHDPSLYDRLSSMAVPSLVAWGENDQIVDVAYGQRLAGAIPNSRFEVVGKAGHFPHIEQLDKVVDLIKNFN
jgi:pimeloyl-ACP methyl ester carboxylesterase